MLSNKLITKSKFIEFLSNTLVNKYDTLKMMHFFTIVQDLSIHEKLMFLLYNEYITYSDLFQIIPKKVMPLDIADIEISNNDMDSINEEIQNIISLHENKLSSENINSFVKRYFFRDYVVTLKTEYYKDKQNMFDQLTLIYNLLTDDEKTFLSTVFGFTDGNNIILDPSVLYEFVRFQEWDGKTYSVSLSGIEKSSNYLNIASDLLNMNFTITGYNKPDVNKVMFLSVLNKISGGTIH